MAAPLPDNSPDNLKRFDWMKDRILETGRIIFASLKQPPSRYGVLVHIRDSKFHSAALILNPAEGSSMAPKVFVKGDYLEDVNSAMAALYSELTIKMEQVLGELDAAGRKRILRKYEK